MDAITGGVLGGLFDLIDKLFTTDEEKANARLKVMELHSKGELAQLAVNAKEAEHANMFVAGWRPFIGWVCGFAFAYNFLIFPLMKLALFSWAWFTGQFIDVDAFPVLDLSEMMPILMGMLGLGAMRSWEKTQGVARETLDTASTPVDDGVDRRANKGN